MKLTNVLRKVGRIAIEAPKKLPPSILNEEWTKKYLIIPLLEALGWGNSYEVQSEDSPGNKDASMNFLLKPEQPNAPSIFVAAKPLLTLPPRYRDHDQIKMGLEQSKAYGSDFLIWTNGDTWQLLAKKLPNAPIYEIQISQEARDATEIIRTAVKLAIFNKITVLDNSKTLTEQIKAYWREVALSQAFCAVSGEGIEETGEVMRRNLPEELAISSEEVREFFTKFQPPYCPVTKSFGKATREIQTCREERGIAGKIIEIGQSVSLHRTIYRYFPL